MSGRIIPLSLPSPPGKGTVHGMADALDGFQVAHESASGGSWGDFSGPYRAGQEAIAAAYSLKRDTYEGVSDVFVCDAAVRDGNPGVGPPSIPGDF